MTPNWFPWIFVGGIIFIILGFIGAKYKDKEYKKIQYLQDFISGSILIAFTGVLMPDLFPKMELPNELGLSGGNASSVDDFDLQVGPPRLAGR
jgi:uncharacterized membrane protein